MYRLPLYPFSNQNIHSNHRNANHHLGLSGKSRFIGVSRHRTVPVRPKVGLQDTSPSCSTAATASTGIGQRSSLSFSAPASGGRGTASSSSAPNHWSTTTRSTSTTRAIASVATPTPLTIPRTTCWGLTAKPAVTATPSAWQRCASTASFRWTATIRVGRSQRSRCCSRRWQARRKRTRSRRPVPNDTQGPYGTLKVEILSGRGEVLDGYSAEECNTFSGDELRRPVTWNGTRDVSRLSGQPIRVRFHLEERTPLYSFHFRRETESRSMANPGEPGSRGWPS